MLSLIHESVADIGFQGIHGNGDQARISHAIGHGQSQNTAVALLVGQRRGVQILGAEGAVHGKAILLKQGGQRIQCARRTDPQLFGGRLVGLGDPFL